MTESTELELVAANDRAPIIAGNTPVEITDHAYQIARHLKGVIDDCGLAVKMGTNRDGTPREHVTLEGWQLLGSLVGSYGGQPLHPDTVWARRMPREDDVIAYEARVEVRTSAGDVVGTAESMCTNAERDRRHAAEHAIRSMAETRAAVRAYKHAEGWLVSLAGMSSTPAEDMPAEAIAVAELPEWAQDANGDEVAAGAGALARILEAADATDDVAGRTKMFGEVIRHATGGEIPSIAMIALSAAAGVLEPRDQPASDAQAPPAAPETADQPEPSPEAASAAGGPS